MHETRVKVCGITSPEDAATCHALGADYLGVIFAASPRRATPAQARDIRSAVPTAALVGVFRGDKLETVAQTAASCRLDLIQLHGDESPAYCDALRARTSLPLLKTILHGQIRGPEDLAAYRAAGFFLFDLSKGASDACRANNSPGCNADRSADSGPGSNADRSADSSPGSNADRSADCDAIRRQLWIGAVRASRKGYRVFLAGRLAPTNVRAAIAQTRPFCVDVCRGVEQAPGVKDAEAVRHFIKEARG
jgi:phosphoribosylanthranilate isomerase